jgi:rhodanese-related sulfurtransferase
MDDISVKELKDRIDKGEKVNLVDVREEWEYDEKNLGAKLIPLGDLPSRTNELAEWKDEEIVIHCKSGGRSGRAKKYLETQGFSKVRNLLGGIDEYLSN